MIILIALVMMYLLKNYVIEIKVYPVNLCCKPKSIRGRLSVKSL